MLSRTPTSLALGMAAKAGGLGLAALHLHRQKHSVAVVLSGNGVYDGTEVHEAAAVVAALTRGGAKPIFVAPDINQVRAIPRLVPKARNWVPSYLPTCRLGTV